MSSDQHPVPLEALPPGWGPVECCRDRLAYRRARPPIELVADRTPADCSHPGLGLGFCWELQYQCLFEDREVTERIGRVSTRHAAVEGLLECMSRLHGRLENRADPAEIRAALADVSLAGAVPDGSAR